MGDNNNLYYESENGEASVEIEGSDGRENSVASPIDVANNHAYRDPYTNEILYGKAELYKLNKTIEPGETYTLPDGFHEGTIIKAKDLNEFTYGTATADDIAFNKTAWVNGRKVVGTSRAANIPNVTATPDDVVDGKTFIGSNKDLSTGRVKKTVGHSNDKVITSPINLDGFYKDVTISPIDTSEDTAGEGDIVLGAIAHSGGAKIVGTLNISEEAARRIYTNSQAQPEDVLETKKFARPDDDGSNVIIGSGTMKVNAPQNIILDNGELYTIPKGYHNGTGTLTAPTLENKTRGNATSDDLAIGKKAWVNGIEITGTMRPDANIPEVTAVDDDVLEGKTFVGSDKTKSTGTIKRKDPINREINNNEAYNIPPGYYAEWGRVSCAHLSTKTPGTATRGDLAIGKTAWVNGEKITGTATADAGIPSVTATTSDVLEGVTFVGSDKTKSTGTIKKTVGHTNDKTITEPLNLNGYYKDVTISPPDTSGDTATADDVRVGKVAHSRGEVINGTLNIEKEAIDLIRVTGPAHVGDVLEGKGIVRVSDDGRSIVKEVGTIKRNAPVYKKLNDGESYTIPTGYHSGQGNIYTPTLKEKTPGDATKYDLADGKIAWVNGEKITANTKTLKEFDTLERTTIDDTHLIIKSEDTELNGIYGMSHNVMGNRRLIFDKFPPSSIDKIYKNTYPNPQNDILTKDGKNFNNYIFAIPTPDMSYGYIEKTDGSDDYRFVKNTNENYANSLSGMIYADKLISIDQVVVNLYDGDNNNRRLVYSVSARYDVEYYKKNRSKSEIGKHIKYMLDNQNVIYNGMAGHFTTITNENMSFAIAFTPPLKHTGDDGFGNFGIGIFPCLDDGKHALMRLFEYSMKEKDQNANILAFGNGIALFAEVKFFGVRSEE